jgi:hypothetical protein
MNKRLWILGAADPEMAAIERLLQECGETVEHATVRDGVRVHPGNAYSERVDPVCADRYLHSNIYSVECAAHYVIYGDSFSVDVPNRVDHHRPGDPGYGKPPADYWLASSLGQVIDRLHRLNVETLDIMMSLVPDHKLICAADHCLAHAYRGECPGVDPDDLMRWRVASRAAFQGRPEAEVMVSVEAAIAALQSAITPAGCIAVGNECYDADGMPWPLFEIADMRGRHVPELPEAASRTGICFIADGLPGPDGRIKVVCQSGTPEQIRSFIEEWAPANGLVDIYGDPARGFAGGYI